MLKRLLTLPYKQSLFLLGARNTGKSTLIKQQFYGQDCLWLDLLDPVLEDQFIKEPNEFKSIVMSLPSNIRYIVIDEIQKVPKLLDVVHSLIEKTSKHFIMTGSSARKLRHGAANLLAGRAFVYYFFPFSFIELGNRFDLDTALQWGLLPKVYSLQTNQEKRLFLQAYTQTYLKEEVSAEQLTRKMDPFRRFLEVAAQSNGKIINYANIARDVGVDDKTVKQYFSILEDTLIGFILDPFHLSFRKRLSLKPKFYFFDLGVTRALARYLTIPLQPGTSAYGEAFEHFILLECYKLATYYQLDYRFSYLRTKDHAEIDLIIERPGLPILLIEIKSASQVKESDLSSFNRLIKDFGEAEAVCFSRDSMIKQFGAVTVMPWRKGICQYFVKGDKE